MDNKITKLIETIIHDCECDDRIPSGIFELHDVVHMEVLAEKMAARGIANEEFETLIEKALAVDEGKYPDRQAYNKEGWLVTFPSKEYRDAAIKKGTHAISDPTHGKGGMNLYYKRRGKQKRQTTQSASSTQTDTEKQTAQPTQPNQPNAQPTSPSDGNDMVKKGSDIGSSPTQKQPTQGQVAQKDKPIAPSEPSASDTSTEPTDSSAEPTTPSKAPAIDVPVVTTPPVQYAEVSKKFASQKGWASTPYDEYHDKEGNPMAVVGLSGEIVPIKSTDREEYKLFAEKQMSA